MKARHLVRIAGLAASIAAIGWIVVRFVRSGALDLLATVPTGTWLLIVVALVACGAIYAVASCLLAFAWWRMMTALAMRAIPALPLMATYAVSQYGKYLPGNVMHYAIRHAWSRRYGVAHSALALSTLLEAALLVLSALCLALLADLHRLRVLSMLDPRLAIVLVVSMLAALGIALAFARRHAVLERFRLPALPPAGVLVLCIACYLAFLATSAALLDALARALGIEVASFAMLLAASAASWLAGFVVVGAPGGLGVREAAFVALAGPALGESRALLLIGMFRIVTFLGDTLFFLAGSVAARRSHRAAAEAAAHTSSHSG